MKYSSLVDSQNRPFQFGKKPIGVGGQAEVFDIISGNYTNHVLKQYKVPSRTNFGKINFFLQHPLSFTQKMEGQFFAWPKDIAYYNGNPVGIITHKMVSEDSSVQIQPIELLLADDDYQRYGKSWAKYMLGHEEAFRNRLVVCCNLAQRILTIHRSSYYAVVDFNPNNFLIDPVTGYVSIIDVDNFQIKNGSIQYASDVYSSEYAPPEGVKAGFAITGKIVSRFWDSYSYAILAYKLLLGIHPFIASHRKDLSLEQMVEQGQFVWNHKSDLMVIPEPHLRFNRLPVMLQAMFKRAFVFGHEPNARPKINEWLQVLSNVLREPGSKNWRY